MTAKTEEGFRNEQQARQLAQREIMNGLKNEENARQMVQNDLITIKEKIRQLELGSGSGSTVGSDASTAVGKRPSGTFARPPPRVGIRLNDFFMPRKMEFKGWVADYKQSSYQGLSETDVSNFIKDLHQMVPDQYRKCIDWYQTRTEQGTWPIKTMVSMWFNNETNLPKMVGLLDIISTELKKELHKLRGRELEKEAIGEGPCFVLERPQRGERG